MTFTNTSCSHICLTGIKFKDNFGFSCGICFGMLMINEQPADVNLSSCNLRKHEKFILQKNQGCRSSPSKDINILSIQQTMEIQKM